MHEGQCLRTPMLRSVLQSILLPPISSLHFFLYDSSHIRNSITNIPGTFSISFTCPSFLWLLSDFQPFLSVLFSHRTGDLLCFSAHQKNCCLCSCRLYENRKYRIRALAWLPVSGFKAAYTPSSSPCWMHDLNILVREYRRGADVFWTVLSLISFNIQIRLFRFELNNFLWTLPERIPQRLTNYTFVIFHRTKKLVINHVAI